MDPATDPRRPTVRLSGEDGNAFAIIGRVRRALRHSNYNDDEINQFTKEASAGDYDHVLQTAMRWAECE